MSRKEHPELEIPQQEYSAQSIKVLEGLEGVRKRPAMYIGSTDIAGLHHLVYEVVDNSVDEALAGHCKHIYVTLHADNSCSVLDDGRGIPVDIHPTEGVSAAQVVLTKLHAGGKFAKEAYRYSGGLHGVGVSVVNALSSKLELTVFRSGTVYHQVYQIGTPQAALAVAGSTTKRGTLVRFTPDATIFSTTDFQFDVLAHRFREMAFLNKGLSITITDERSGNEENFYFEGGIVSFIEHINAKKQPILDAVVSMSKDDGTHVIDFAFQYNDGFSEQTYSFVNTIRTTEGGTHEAGFRAALTKVCNKYAQKYNLTKQEALSSDDVREGLVAVLSIKIPEPQFEGQTKTKLGNSEVKGVVDSWIYSFLDTYFEEHPAEARKILQKALLAQQARNAAKKARELTRRKTALESTVLPGKLADCTSTDPAESELFIVEGDSAGGTARQARNRFTQAVLPLRGKIINVEKARFDKMLANSAIQDIITAIGAGIGNQDFAIEKVRYHKIVLMTDADVDGAHIRILLLTFFFRHMLPLIERGYLYIAQPPLYKVKLGKVEQYLKDEKQFKKLIFDWTADHTHLKVGQVVYKEEVWKTLLSELYEYHTLVESVSAKHTLLITHVHLLAKARFLHQPLPDDLQRYVHHLSPLTPGCTWTIEKEEEGAAGSALFVCSKGKVSWSVSAAFLFSKEMEMLAKLYAPIAAIEEGWILEGPRHARHTGSSLVHLVQAILTTGKDSMQVQRYKGLGEMNFDQLWETTMDPKVRSLFKVTVEDPIEADLAFASLMGEEVSDRKEFIEKYAQFVRNLDA